MSSALPYTLEMTALRHLSMKSYGTLTSLEPALGALTGLWLLHEQLTLVHWLGIGAVMMAAGPLIADVLFGYGAVQDEQELALLGHTVMAFTVGLVPFTLYWVLIRGWSALEDTKTVFLQGFLLNAVNMLVSFGLFQIFQNVVVLALGTASAYWVTFLFAWRQLNTRLGGLETRATALALFRMLLAGAATFAVVWAVDHQINPAGKLGQYLLLAGVSLLGLAVFLVAAKLLRVSEVDSLVGMVRGKLRR
jgi:putative peptidoglycan lipid II flippase